MVSLGTIGLIGSLGTIDLIGSLGTIGLIGSLGTVGGFISYYGFFMKVRYFGGAG